MMQKVVDWFGGEKRFYIIMITLILMWSLLMGFFYIKAEEVTKDPCSICAHRLNEDVVCSIGDGMRIVRRTFYQDFEINDSIIS